MCQHALPLHALMIQRGRKVKQRSLSVVRPSSIRHCYFIHTYVSILSPSLWSIFLTWYYITAHMGERTPKNSTTIVFWKDEMKPAAWKVLLPSNCGSSLNVFRLHQFNSVFAVNKSTPAHIWKSQANEHLFRIKQKIL